MNNNLNNLHSINSTIKSLQDAISLVSQKEIQDFIDLMLQKYKQKSKIFIFGNGGSAATASHFVCDINKGVSFNFEKRFQCVSLNDNVPTMLAYANDINYESVFEEQLRTFLTKDDMVIAISGSGNSKNIINAIEYANSISATTVGFTGYDGGKLREIAKYSVNANCNDMQISEDIHHIVLNHITMKILKNILTNN